MGILITKIVSWRHGSHKKLSCLPKFPAMIVVPKVFQWYPLEGCKHGDLHIKATWLNLSKDLKSLEQQVR